MKPEEVVARVRSVVGIKCAYKLGAGGTHPEAKSPVNIDHECDCSGLVPWGFGFSRYQPHIPFYVRKTGGYVNTDAMYSDAISPTGMFIKIDRAIVGCALVYPSGNGHAHGHMSIVTEVENGKATKIVDCSMSNPFGHAIQERDPHVFFSNPKSIYVWYDGVDHP